MELLEVINCAPGPRSVATFVVQEALVGAPAPKRLRMEFWYSRHSAELKLGSKYQLLAVLVSDGSSTEHIDMVPVARTIGGAWAIPITVDPDRYAFPCSRYTSEPERLQFRVPRPRESLADLGYDEEDVDDLKLDDSYTVQRGYVYANKGVLLEHVAAAYAGKSAAQMLDECP